MSDPETAYWDLHADFCKSLAHPVRLRILAGLADGELSFAELGELTRQSKVNLSRHLAVLVERGVVHRRREGRQIRLSIGNRKILRAYRLMSDAMSEILQREADAIGISRDRPA
jgi:DNA-binding transcriptional ArsR family regulator